MNFRVWAPKPKRVELLFRGQRLRMEDAGGGWRALRVADAKPGELYAFSLDGGPPRPDPRSMDLPQGVHGPSRIVDHGAYDWRCPSFRPRELSSAIIYELHVGTFTPEGTLDAAIGRLHHLVELGVTHVELMPINSFDGARGWGYDGVAWFAPHRAYTGDDGPDAVKRFVDACHERGLAALLDVVYNHLGPSGNYLAEFGDYFTDVYSTPWGPAINLDGPGSDEARRLIVDNALMWLRDYRFDGLRIDAVHAFYDRSAVHVLEQLRREVDRLMARTGRRAVLIAESDLNDPRLVRSLEAGGYGVDAQWSDDFHHALHALLTGERAGYYADFGAVADLAKAWRDAFVMDGRSSAYRRRSHGRPATGLRSDRCLAYAQTHDQVGNRALGERLSQLIQPEALELVAALVMLSPYIPMLFQGEEWGSARPFLYFTNHQDAALAQAVREGRKREFAQFLREHDLSSLPDPQDEATFAQSQLRWSELDEPAHVRLLEWHRRLIAFRRSRADFAPETLGRADVAWSEQPRWLCAKRGGLWLCFNLGGGAVEIPAPAERNSPATGTQPSIALTNDATARVADGRVRLRAFGVAAIATE